MELHDPQEFVRALQRERELGYGKAHLIAMVAPSGGHVGFRKALFAALFGFRQDSATPAVSTRPGLVPSKEV